MSRTTRRALHHAFVWLTVVLITLQPTMAGHCGRRPFRHLLSKLKSAMHCRPASGISYSCGSTGYSSCYGPTYTSYSSPSYSYGYAPASCGSYSSYAAPAISYGSSCGTYGGETIVSSGYSSYSSDYVVDSGYESYAAPEVVYDAGYDSSYVTESASSRSSCCGYQSQSESIAYESPSYTTYESSPVDDGYVSSYISDSSDCGCGTSVVSDDSGYVDSGYSSEGTIVEDGSYDNGVIVEDGSYSDGVIVEDGGHSDGVIVEEGTVVEDSVPSFQDSSSEVNPDAASSQPAEVQAPSDPAPVQPSAPTEDAMDDDLGGDFMDDTDPDTGDLAAPDDNDDMFGGADDSMDEPADDADSMFDEEPGDAGDMFEEPNEDEPVDQDLDDLFGQVEQTNVEVEPIAMRTWTDNTGNYETVGKLETVGPDFIRIMKENGRFSTVPMDRLSNPDIEYVRMIAKRSGETELKFAAN